MYMYPCDEVSFFQRVLRATARKGLSKRRANPARAAQPEKDRMDIYHKLFLVARRDQLHQAPLPTQWRPRILDLGTGTGIWAIDMAE